MTRAKCQTYVEPVIKSFAIKDVVTDENQKGTILKGLVDNAFLRCKVTRHCGPCESKRKTDNECYSFIQMFMYKFNSNTINALLFIKYAVI